MLYAIDRKGSRLALDEEVQPTTTEANETVFTLSDLGVQTGDRGLVWQDATYPHAKLHGFLAEWIYRDQTLTDLAMPAMWVGVAVFGVGLLVAIPKDIARARARRHGQRLKGPELVTAPSFNRRLRADGVGFVQVPRLVARLCGRRPWIRLPRAIESSHLLIMGDSGTGKSALIRQILRQLEDRGDTAIVYDPALEYTPQFYTPERGDVILNPLDLRSPYWSPGDELRHDAEALTLATSLFPDRPNENPFFVEGPRRIFAHLLTFRPTAAELAVLAMPRGGTRPAGPRHVLRRHDRSTGARTTQRRPRFAQYGGRHAEARARRIRHDAALERRRLGGQTARLAFPHEHAGNTHATRPAHESLARHARVTAHEPGAAQPAFRVVRSG